MNIVDNNIKCKLELSNIDEFNQLIDKLKIDIEKLQKFEFEINIVNQEE